MPLDVGAAHHAVKFSFAHVLHNLAYKYSQHEDESDVIDLKRLKVVENNGSLDASETRRVGDAYQDHCRPVHPSLLAQSGNGVDEDGECEPEEYTDLEDDEDDEEEEAEDENSESCASDAEGSCEEEEGWPADMLASSDAQEASVLFPCSSDPYTCMKPFCFACAAKT